MPKVKTIRLGGKIPANAVSVSGKWGRVGDVAILRCV